MQKALPAFYRGKVLNRFMNERPLLTNFNIFSFNNKQSQLYLLQDIPFEMIKNRIIFLRHYMVLIVDIRESIVRRRVFIGAANPGPFCFSRIRIRVFW